MPSSNYRAIVIAVGIVGILSGLALLLLPFDRYDDDLAASVSCGVTLSAAFGGGEAGCGGEAWRRLVIGLAFVAGGAGAIALIVRKTRMPDPLLANGPVPPSWEATGGPPPG